MRRRFVIVNDRMQQSYRYELTAPAGRDFDPEFRPDLTPKEMLERVLRQVSHRLPRRVSGELVCAGEAVAPRPHRPACCASSRWRWSWPAWRPEPQPAGKIREPVTPVTPRESNRR
jgi:hypothetical protein